MAPIRAKIKQYHFETLGQSVTTNQDIVLYKQCFEKRFLKNLENYHKLPKCITVTTYCDPVALFNNNSQRLRVEPANSL